MRRISLSAYCAVMVGAMTLGVNAYADGYEVAKEAPRDEARKFVYSFTLAPTSDYVLRGISQSDNDPVMQGSIDIGYGIFYAGAWASGIDFDAFSNEAELELDWYGGIRPTWGGLTFDFGFLLYTYPGSGWTVNPPPVPGNLVPYIEYKAGVSGAPFTNATLGAIVYYANDSFGETGPQWTFEGTAGYTFHAVGPFTPTVNVLLGHIEGTDQAYLNFNGFDSYTYWNAGLALAVEKLTFDFRYWDTAGAENAVSTSPGLTCTNHYCDERFVFSVKVTVP